MDLSKSEVRFIPLTTEVLHTLLLSPPVELLTLLLVADERGARVTAVKSLLITASELQKSVGSVVRPEKSTADDVTVMLPEAILTFPDSMFDLTAKTSSRGVGVLLVSTRSTSFE